MNASGGMHRKFSRREPIVFQEVFDSAPNGWPAASHRQTRGDHPAPGSLAASAAAATQRVVPTSARPSAAGSRVVNSGPWPSLRQTMAAVGHHYRPGDERGRLVGEKQHARGDLRRRATAPDRSRRRGGGFEL